MKGEEGEQQDALQLGLGEDVNGTEWQEEGPDNSLLLLRGGSRHPEVPTAPPASQLLLPEASRGPGWDSRSPGKPPQVQK